MSRRTFIPAVGVLTILALTTVTQLSDYGTLPIVQAQGLGPATIAPSQFWGPLFGSTGDVQIDVNKTGIAVRVEVPREFLVGVVTGENDTHFIESDIRNDYYYYSVVDESTHWTYDWNRTVSDGPCFKPGFSVLGDRNAPWCVEIWNYFNGSFLTFKEPRFIRFHDLRTPDIAGRYNFTLFVADHTNGLGYPDFVHAFSKTLVVPISMIDNPANIYGFICDFDFSTDHTLCPTIKTKGVVYARNINTGQNGRAYVNQTTGFFNLTGLAPGDYQIRGSAGNYTGWAFSLSDPVQELGLQRGESRQITGGTLKLRRAPRLCGTIKYRDSLEPDQTKFLAHSLTNHPYLKKIGFKVLNITVEATEYPDAVHIFRYQNVSRNLDIDSFKLITGFGVKYVGLDPYGTEFAGLPPNGTLSVKFYITGYLHDAVETVNVSPPAPGAGPACQANNVGAPNIVMQSGGVISGTLEFRNLVDIETPHQGEVSLEIGPPTDRLFGGNVLIEAFDQNGGLRGIVVINGTRQDGKTTYANFTFVRFYVIGFSEFYNRTWTGWNEKDTGLDTQTYSLNVWIRGYEQQTAGSTVTVPRGANRTVTVRMVRGGAILATITSFNNRPGTRALQAEKTFRFLNLSIPVKARVYFYDSGGRIVGYVERTMVQGVNGVGKTSFTVIFAGQNWSIREIWFFSLVPTHITSDTYTVKAFTLGYVQQEDFPTFAELTGLSRVLVALLIGNDIGATAPVFADPNLFWHIPEHDHVIAETFANATVLSGATPQNLTAGIPTLLLPISGFGGMVQNGKLNGQGHFFYVAPDGTPYFDYGLDVGNYTTQIPEFGFNKHFTQLSTPDIVTFNDLFLAHDAFLDVIAMGRIVQGTPSNPDALVTGWIAMARTNETIPLSWVEVRGVSDTFDRSVPTLDGRYDGKGALFLPAGIYNITFSVVFYQTQPAVVQTVQWNGTYPILPPIDHLCPTADTSNCLLPSPVAPSQMGESSEGSFLVVDALMRAKLSLLGAFSQYAFRVWWG